MTVKPKFTPAEVAATLQKKLNNIEAATIRTLSQEGERFIINARSKTIAQGSYSDQTGNLRSSIGYVILKDGRQIIGAFPGDKPEGVAQAKRTASEASRKHTKGYVLIVVAGMNYAHWVEKNGKKDVLYGSAAIAEGDIKKALQQLTKKIK